MRRRSAVKSKHTSAMKHFSLVAISRANQIFVDYEKTLCIIDRR